MQLPVLRSLPSKDESHHHGPGRFGCGAELDTASILPWRKMSIVTSYHKQDEGLRAAIDSHSDT